MLALTLALALAQSLERDADLVTQVLAYGPVPSLESVMPRDHADLVRLLSDNRYRVRKLASEELRRMGRDASLSLAWGMRMQDKAIAHECSRLRDLLYVCPSCDGSGECTACLEDQFPPRDDGEPEQEGMRKWPCPAGCNWESRCRPCDGTGDVRYKLGWDAEFGGRIWVRRDLFAVEQK